MTYSQFRGQQQVFESSDGTLKYIDKGKGEVLVLIHGIPTSSWLYRKMIDELAQNYRVIVPDMLGFGSSSSPKGYEIYEPKEHARRLLELMTSLHIHRWNHVLHDAGGLWTWELIAQSSESIQKLIILNTIIYEDGFNPPIRFKKGLLAKFIMSLYSNGLMTNMMLNGLFKTGLVENNLNSEDLEGYKKPLLEGKTKAMYHFFTNTCNNLPDYSNVIKNLGIPKLIIWGKHDEFLIFDKMKEKVISDLNISINDVHTIDARHFIQEEKPDLINSLILDFLNRN